MASTDDSDIPETGAVFTFGKSRFAENLPNKFWVKNDRVLQVACGDQHTALVAESGRMFMFGPNDFGQLGIGTQTIANRPTCIKSLKHEKSRLVACGRSHTIIATESGNIYSFGANGEGQLGVEGVDSSNVPTHVESLPSTRWKMLAAGSNFSMALTEEGQVYVWGDNAEGQLGMGSESEIHTPTELDVGQRVTCISCGYYHSALVTESGDLYTFGEHEGGKLGLGDDTDESNTPQHVMAISERVKSVSCGGSHTVAITDKGKVYAFGGGCSGQLGLGVSVLESESPSLLKLPFRVARVCCGENFTAVISEKGQLYTFGDGRHGKLALGQESFSNQFTLHKVDRFLKFNVSQVACGGCHMIVTAVPKMQNGEVESEEEEDEAAMLNGTVRDSMNLNLSRTFSARDRRRNASPLPLHRTLPPLGNNRALPALNATVPPIKMNEQKITKTEAVPRLQRSKKIDKTSEEEESEEEADNGQAEQTKPKALSRKVPPMPSQEDRDVQDSKGDNQDSHQSEEEGGGGETDNNDQEKVRKSDDEEKEEETEEDKNQVDTVANESKLTKQEGSEGEADLDDKGNEADGESGEEDEEKEKKGSQEEEKPKEEQKEEEEEEGSEVEEEALVDLKRAPVPLPRKAEDNEGKEEEEEESEEEEEEKEKDKKKKDKKDKKGEKEDKKKDKKDKKKKGKKEEEEEEEDKEEEKEDKKSKKGKDKKKDKEDKKKGKEDKKKKGKKDEEEEEEEEEGEEEEKKKDKNKKKEKEKKKKKGDQDKDEEDKDKKDENENEEEKREGEKKGEEPKPKKKSRLCTVL